MDDGRSRKTNIDHLISLYLLPTGRRLCGNSSPVMGHLTHVLVQVASRCVALLVGSPLQGLSCPLGRHSGRCNSFSVSKGTVAVAAAPSIHSGSSGERSRTRCANLVVCGTRKTGLASGVRRNSSDAASLCNGDVGSVASTSG